MWRAKTGECCPEEGSINGVVRSGKVDKAYNSGIFVCSASTPLSNESQIVNRLMNGSSSRPLIGSIMVQMQNQLRSDIELAQHLCIDWLIAAMGSVCYEPQYHIS